jgi:hypothetical protein
LAHFLREQVKPSAGGLVHLVDDGRDHRGIRGELVPGHDGADLDAQRDVGGEGSGRHAGTLPGFEHVFYAG